MMIVNISLIESAYSTCPPYTHVDDVKLGLSKDLPNGYIAFELHNNLCRTSTKFYSPCVIPNTENEGPISVDISDDGKWILYISQKSGAANLIRATGEYKTPIPINPGYRVASFYRNSPYGTEIFFVSSGTTIDAIRVWLSDTNATFGAVRRIVQVDDSLQLCPYDSYGITFDQVFGRLWVTHNDTLIHRLGYLTIPNGGKGIATSANAFKWKNDLYSDVWGCYATQSHDGKYCLANPGGMGRICTPPDHKGFVITPFRRDSDPSIDINLNVDSLGVSLNWCPSEFRYGGVTEVEFNQWNFSNNSDYVAGILMGTLALVHGIWIVEWKTNTWTLLTPRDSLVDGSVALYLGEQIDSLTCSDISQPPDTGGAGIDLFNPHYEIVKPIGGETYYIGQQCTVIVTSEKSGSAEIMLSINDGKTYFMAPGFVKAIDPQIDHFFVFAIPDSFSIPINGINTSFSAVSTKCKVKIQDYNPTLGYYDFSKNDFTIANSAAAHLLSSAARSGRQLKKVVVSFGSLHTSVIDVPVNRPGNVGAMWIRIYSLEGRSLCSFPARYKNNSQILLPVRLSPGTYLLSTTFH